MRRRSKNEGDISKLPVWAQHRMQKLESDCEYYLQRMQEMAGQASGPLHAGPPIIARPYDKKPLRLPRGSKVIFQLEEGDQYLDVPSIECYVEKLTKDGQWVLSVRACDGVLLVQPEHANSIHAVVKKRYGDF